MSFEIFHTICYTHRKYVERTEIMIHVTLSDNDPIAQFIEARALQLGQEPAVVAEQILQEGFATLVQTLHEQYMQGDLSQGKMAEILGINRLDLIHLLEVLNLQVTNL